MVWSEKSDRIYTCVMFGRRLFRSDRLDGWMDGGVRGRPDEIESLAVPGVRCSWIWL